MLLRWNDELPFVKFSVGEDERPLLVAELPVADRRRGRAGPRARPPARGRRPLHADSADWLKGGGWREPPSTADGATARARGSSTATPTGSPSCSTSRRRRRTRAAPADARDEPADAADAAQPREPAVARVTRLLGRRRVPRSSCSRSRPRSSSRPLAPAAGPRAAEPRAAAAAPTSRSSPTPPTRSSRRATASASSIGRHAPATTRSETKTRRFFFDHAFLAVQPGATSVEITGAKGATGEGRRSGRRTRRCCGSTSGSRLYSGKSRDFTVTFDLVDKGKPAEPPRPRRPEPRHAPGLGLRVRRREAAARSRSAFPAGYDVAVESGDVRQDATDRPTAAPQLTTEPLAKPLDFFAFVSAQRRRSTYAETPLTVAGRRRDVELMLRGWEDDPALGRAGRRPVHTQPARPARGDRPAVAARRAARPSRRPRAAAPTATPGCSTRPRTASRSPTGPTGWSSLHEAAHGWFNGSLLADRWANEGFAALYAQRAAKAIDVREDEPRPDGRRSRRRAIPLNAWAIPPSARHARSRTTRTAVATETFGYAASLALARAIAERAGDEALRAVWAVRPSAGVGAYQPGSSGVVRRRAADPPRRSTAPPTGGRCSTCSRARPARTSPTCGASGSSGPRRPALLDARADARAVLRADARARRRLGAAARRSATRSARGSSTRRASSWPTPGRCSPSAARSSRWPIAAASTLPATSSSCSRTGDSSRPPREAEAERNAMLSVAGGRRRADPGRRPAEPDRDGGRGSRRRTSSRPEAAFAAGDLSGDAGRGGRRVPRLDGGLAGGPPARAARARGAGRRARAGRGRRRPSAGRPSRADGLGRRRLLTRAMRTSGVARSALIATALAGALSRLRGGRPAGGLAGPPVPRRHRRPGRPRRRRPRGHDQGPLRRRAGQRGDPGGRRRRGRQPEAQRRVGWRRHPLLLRRREPRRAARGDPPPGDAGRRAGPGRPARRARTSAWSPSRSATTSTSARPPTSGSSSTCPRASRARRATSGWGRRSRRSSPGRSATAGASGSTSRRRSTSTSRART